MTYTAEDIRLAYQHGYAHGANRQPPLEGAEVVRMLRLEKPEGPQLRKINPEGEAP